MKFSDPRRAPRNDSQRGRGHEAWGGTDMVDVCRLAVNANGNLKPLSLLGAGLLRVDFAGMILARGVIQRTRQCRQNIWAVDSVCRGHCDRCDEPGALVGLLIPPSMLTLGTAPGLLVKEKKFLGLESFSGVTVCQRHNSHGDFTIYKGRAHSVLKLSTEGTEWVGRTSATEFSIRRR